MKEMLLNKTLELEYFAFDPLYFSIFKQLLEVNSKERFSLATKILLKNINEKNKNLENKIINAANKIVWQANFFEQKNSIKQSLSNKEKILLYEGMLLTRMVDNKLKQMFMKGEIVYEGKAFAGKGFRSLGQEAIYAATLKLNCGKAFITKNGYQGDVAGPMIRDLGVFLAMSDHDIETALNAQAAKEGPPTNGCDLHLGDMSKGIITAAAPLAISVQTLLGIALGFSLKKEKRIAVSFIGEGGTSLGEWHEAINMASVYSLPMIFCIQNNQQALSTPRALQSKAFSFSDKGLGYGLNSVTINGNDPEEIAASFAVLAEYARNNNQPSLIELVTMRMCGHAHHDDMLYLGHEPSLSLNYPEVTKEGYANKNLYDEWRTKDPIACFEKKLIQESIINKKQVAVIQEKLLGQIENAFVAITKRSWSKTLPKVFKEEIIFYEAKKNNNSYQFSSAGKNYLQAIEQAIKESFLENEHCVMLGEDVAFPYGNAFMMFKNIMEQFKHRLLNTPISENAIIGSLVGLSMSGFKPIGEMQFNDFVACCMNQVVNNAAQFFFRHKINLPFVLRMPYGGLRRAGPYHSQDTTAWFYSTPGLKIFAPSTPNDAYNLFKLAVNDPDPVLFYEHIALYREPSIKQEITSLKKESLLCANVINEGKDLTIISYGAYVHRAYNVAKEIEKNYHKTIEVIDLRFLSPIDLVTCFKSIKKTSKVLLCGEDSKTGSILESLSSIIGEQLFSHLDAPVAVAGSKNTHIPYAPSLEDEYLLSLKEITNKALWLLNY